ncbi:hypothetical protein NDU88_001469 [Pleurodeles waltl]|uniref:Uncharacterized protein n=1 Tax=Pleurodeles waltl TaxID=8319 RepID=A0AAV7R783_PLEWA|nr:hypothetical protein NDU88_001469 [Pleurodeles waltl]
MITNLSKYVSTFTALIKAQFNMRHMFNNGVFGRAGRRGLSAGKEYKGPIMIKEEEEDILEVQQPPSTPDEEGDLEPEVTDRLCRAPRQLVLNKNQNIVVEKEIASMLEKNAIVRVSVQGKVYISTLFLVVKK